ncbi:hypothetical protein, partial [Acinetobacter baumannii]
YKSVLFKNRIGILTQLRPTPKDLPRANEKLRNNTTKKKHHTKKKTQKKRTKLKTDPKPKNIQPNTHPQYQQNEQKKHTNKT